MVRPWPIAIAIILLASTVAQAAGVRAVVDRNQATVGESIALQITIEGGDGQIDLSGISDFKVVSRGSTSSFQMINGRTSRQLIHNYALIPLKTGNLTIPAIPVAIDGRVQRTDPIRISVSEQPSVDSGRRDVYVTAAVSESSPWRGQQFVYTFRLFNAVQIAEAKFQAPAFDGFDFQELEDRPSHRTMINGREFIVTEVNFILVPLKTGTRTIEPAVLQAGLLQRSRRQRPFAGMDAFFGRTEMTTRMVETDPITVEVRPLPSPPAGSTFSGLVGTFDIQANLEKSNIQVGDSTTLAITINGRGNVMDAAAPQIPVPTDFKTYADSPEASIQMGANGTTGSKTFRTALVPVKAGQYRIDPIGMTYFDVETGSYRQVNTAAVDLSVTPSATAETDIDVFRGSDIQPTSLKKRVEFTGRDILPLKEGLEAIQPQGSLRPMWFALLMILPVVGYALTAFILQMKRKDDSPETVMAKRAESALKVASAEGGSDAEFLSALYRALVSAILCKQGVMGTSLTWSEAKDRLLQMGWGAKEAADAAGLLEAIESFNYSGIALDSDNRADLLKRTRQAVRKLTK
ncbi:MAG: BatD family protein [Desulfosarcina sp.]|jgi:hypothetical protein